MGTGINEKMLAANRALITRNRNMNDLKKIDKHKFKPGMIHYVSEGQKIYVSIEPTVTKNEFGQDETVRFTEIATAVNLENMMADRIRVEGTKLIIGL